MPPPGPLDTGPSLPQKDIKREFESKDESTPSSRKHSLEAGGTGKSQRTERIKQKLEATRTPSAKETAEPGIQELILTKSGHTMTMNVENTGSLAIVDIVPDGDLIVIVRPEGCRFRVHTLFLTTCSPVLKKIIVEQQQASISNGHESTEIELVGVDGEAFKTFCLHLHKPNSHPLPMTPELVNKVAILAQKYECTDRFIYAADSWLAALKSWAVGQNTRTMWTLTTAALLFGRPKWFRLYSSRLVEKSGSFLGHAQRCHDSLLGMKLALALEEKRSAVGSKQLFSVFNESISGLCLGCFTKAKESFVPQDDCLDCRKPIDDKRPDDRGGLFTGVSGTTGAGKSLFGAVHTAQSATPVPGAASGGGFEFGRGSGSPFNVFGNGRPGR